MSPDLTPLLQVLAGEEPAFHLNGRQRWDVSPGTLCLLADLVKPGQATMEIGVGASTVLFAALRTEHRAISPAPDEFEAVRTWCAKHSVETDKISFIEGCSDEVLPQLSGQVDCALIDGAHAFPMPVVDFHFVRRLVKVGGILVLDDLPIPSVGSVYRFLRAEPNWSQLRIADHRAAAFRLIAPHPHGDPWGSQSMNKRYPEYSFLPPSDRFRVSAGSRLAHSTVTRWMRKTLPKVESLIPTAKRLLR